MKVYTESQAQQQFTDLLGVAEHEEVMIKRKDGMVFLLASKKTASSPFDIDGVNTDVSTQEIIAAVHESRQQLATTPVSCLDLIQEDLDAINQQTPRDINRHAGKITLTQDPLEFQQAIRDEWA